MAWANFDDQFASHPKIVPLSDGAFRLHVSGICYSAQHLTDGLIGAEAVPTLRPKFRPAMLAELVERNLWIKHGDVYEIRDYLQWNRSRDEINEERERKRRVRSEAGRKGAAARWGK
jgi:hypothetical protein